MEECPSTVSLAEKRADEASDIEPDVCGGIKLNANEAQELMKDVASAKSSTLAPDIIVSDENASIAPKLLPTQVSPHL